MSEQDGPNTDEGADIDDPDASSESRDDGSTEQPADERVTSESDGPSPDESGERADEHARGEHTHDGDGRTESESDPEGSTEYSDPERLIATVATQRERSLDPGETDPGTVGQATTEAVDSASTDELARAFAGVIERLASTERTLAQTHERAEDLESRLRRKQADFENYKKRQEKRLEEERARATEDLVERLLDVRDNLSRALDQDENADIRGGVESTLEAFDHELERENVEPIEPSVGTAVDPSRHEVLATVESDQPEDVIAELYRPGYEMAGKVLRPAQVTVSEGTDDEDGSGAEQEGGDETDDPEDGSGAEQEGGDETDDDETGSGAEETV
jgi:molecular chaperone GrpE